MKLTLGLCTCGNFLKISVHNGKKYFNFSKKLLNIEEFFFDEVEKLASKAGGGFRDFSRICIVNGPGRFTGMRISYTFATVYQRLSGAKLYGVSVFDVLAYGFYEKAGLYDAADCKLAVFFRAFRDEFYFCHYEIRAGRLRQSSDPVWLSKWETRKKLARRNIFAIADAEEYPGIYDIVPGRKKCDQDISLIVPENVIKAALYLRKKDVRPMYLKPAKYELTARQG